MSSMDMAYYSCDKYICFLCYNLPSWQMLMQENNYGLGIHAVHSVILKGAKWSRMKMRISYLSGNWEIRDENDSTTSP